MSRLISTLCSFLLLATVAFTPAQAANPEKASKYIETLADQALDIIKKSDSKNAKQQKLERLFADNVDIDWVGRFVMGRYWRKATDEQKNRYLKAYKDFVLSHYASRFTDYTSGDYEITGTSAKEDGEFLVNMALVNPKNPGEPPVLVDYRVRAGKSSFQVFDVIVEGVSMITTQRSEFSAVVAKGGIDHLIKQLETKAISPKDV